LRSKTRGGVDSRSGPEGPVCVSQQQQKNESNKKQSSTIHKQGAP
jgi:hypothetical protein